MMKDIEKHNHLPDYSIAIDDNGLVTFYSKNTAPSPQSENTLYLKPETIEKAKKILHPYRLDVYALEAEWLEFWKKSGEPELKSPDGAFINFCKKRVGSI